MCSRSGRLMLVRRLHVDLMRIFAAACGVPGN